MYERGIWAESVKIDDPAMTRSNGRAFNEWLRAQLKAKKMSQRQLAQQSGVDHSTISRLVRGDRMPSLGTATKLARGLRELGENDEGPQYLGLMGGGVQNPTARVEYALRSDEALGEAQVRQVMEYYLAVRMRRVGTAYGQDTSHLQRVEPSRMNGRSLAPMNSPIVSHPALVAGGGRTAVSDGRATMQTRSPLPPRLRPVRSSDGH
jgi:transcriptional regulator with XRE-family HTH domain